MTHLFSSIPLNFLFKRDIFSSMWWQMVTVKSKFTFFSPFMGFVQNTKIYQAFCSLSWDQGDWSHKNIYLEEYFLTYILYIKIYKHLYLSLWWNHAKKHFSSYFFPTTSPKTQLLLIASFFLNPHVWEWSSWNTHKNRSAVQFLWVSIRKLLRLQQEEEQSGAAVCLFWLVLMRRSEPITFVRICNVNVHQSVQRRVTTQCCHLLERKEKMVTGSGLLRTYTSFCFVYQCNNLFFLSYLYLYVWRHVLYFPGLLPLWKL